mmetsp:Transcript_25629/g.37899  ORF Transcript_25629/g.37899 Transcript_25629/m.37899 type:complete len:80 (-) Transcript_25629:482-721(-)
MNTYQSIGSTPKYALVALNIYFEVLNGPEIQRINTIVIAIAIIPLNNSSVGLPSFSSRRSVRLVIGWFAAKIIPVRAAQ